MLHVLQWLLAYQNDPALAMLPEDGDLSGLQFTSTSEGTESLPAQDEHDDPYSTRLSESFVPSATQQMTEQETDTKMCWRAFAGWSYLHSSAST